MRGLKGNRSQGGQSQNYTPYAEHAKLAEIVLFFNYIRTAIWEGALHGQDAFTIWEGTRTMQELSHQHSIMTRAEATEAAGRTALDLNRLAEHLVDFSKAEAKGAILFSRTSKLLSDKYLQSLQRLYEVVNFLQAPFRFISEDQVVAGG